MEVYSLRMSYLASPFCLSLAASSGLRKIFSTSSALSSSLLTSSPPSSVPLPTAAAFLPSQAHCTEESLPYYSTTFLTSL